MFLQASGIAPPSIAVKSKRLRRACGALDSAGWLCSEAIKEGFASLCSKGASFQFGNTDADGYEGLLAVYVIVRLSLHHRSTELAVIMAANSPND